MFRIISTNQNKELHDKAIDASVFSKETGMPHIKLMGELVPQMDSLFKYAALIDLIYKVVGEYEKERDPESDKKFSTFIRGLLKEDYCRAKIKEMAI